MKLLIVDDERLTREGLVSAIDWSLLNINSIHLAKDGVQGLALAKKYRPELILTDVRMPKLDGIKMAEQLRPLLPDSSIIFISGYSDKQYLKAAIKLKAIRYVEKPIDADEIKEAIKEAIRNNRTLQSLKQSQKIYSIEKLKGLVLDLTYPGKYPDSVYIKRLQEIGISVTGQTCFTTFIAQTTELPFYESAAESIDGLHHKLTAFLKKLNLEMIHAPKAEHCHIFHIWDSRKLSHSTCLQIAELIKAHLEQISPCFITIGKAQCGIQNICHSYSSAVISLQRSFYYAYNTILSADDKISSRKQILIDPVPDFTEALAEKNKEKLLQLKYAVYEMFQGNQTLLPSLVKDIYYKLFMHIEHTLLNLKVSFEPPYGEPESLLNTIESCRTLLELQDVFEDKLNRLFQAMDYVSTESSVIFLVKDFISKNYMNDSLSVKTISDHVFLSSSYVCTMFKTKTGQTLNQYITEYRIEKAKQLLENPRYKITDISFRVGYNDGNYFGKIFKKAIGISPSEYRENKLTC